MGKQVKDLNLNSNAGNGMGGALYFVGFIGAAIYYIQQASTISEGLIGIVKAVFWPAFLVFELFKFLGI